MQWEWCSAQDIRRENPFSTSPLVALSLCSHPTERLGRIDKRLSRGAFEDRVPPEVLTRRDKGTHQRPIPRSVNPEVWRHCLETLEPRWLGLGDRSAIELGGGPGMNDSEKGRNLEALRDQPLRLAFFAENVYKIRESRP
jgi:hypothetical protein